MVVVVVVFCLAAHTTFNHQGMEPKYFFFFVCPEHMSVCVCIFLLGTLFRVGLKGNHNKNHHSAGIPPKKQDSYVGIPWLAAFSPLEITGCTR